MQKVDISKLKQHEIDVYLNILNDPILWSETFLINPENDRPLKINHVQRQILGSGRQKTVIRVHRRAGKSFGLTIYALWYALTHDSAKVLIICPDQAKVDSLIRNIDEFLRVSTLLGDVLSKKNDSKNPVIRQFHNGSTILGFTAGSRSKSGGEAIRGSTADVVIVDEAAFLNKEDWPAIEPIMQGDETRPSVITFVSSTPTAERNRYWEFCTRNQDDVVQRLRWNRVHVPITENPAYDSDRVTQIRSENDEFTFQQEWMAEFPDIGEGVYKRSYIDRAGRAYEYYSLDRQADITQAIRTIGVDWDKFQGVGPNIMVLELDKEHGVYKAVYHEEIEPTKYCLTLATQRIIELNEIFNPSHIYVDRGMAESQVEYLHLYGEQNPASGLSTKVRGISFSENVEVLDPATRELVKKRIKPYMVNLTVKWMEDNRFIYPKSHRKFVEQLQDFKVLSVSDSSIKYSSDNEHIIDAFCLAAYAMHANYLDPFSFKPATNWYVLPVPEVTNSSIVTQDGTRIAYGIIPEPGSRSRNFGKRSLPVATIRQSVPVVGSRRSF